MVWLWRIFLIGAVAVSALIWILVIISVIRFRRRSDEIPSQKQYHIPLEIVLHDRPAGGGGHPVRSDGVRRERIHLVGGAPGRDRRGRGLPVAVAVPLSRRRRHDHRHRTRRRRTGAARSARPSASSSCPTTSTIRSGCPSSSRSATSSPGSTTRSTSTITEPGEWTGRCAEYCGLDHWQMTFDVIAVPREQYTAWINQARLQPQPLVDGQHPTCELPTALRRRRSD